MQNLLLAPRVLPLVALALLARGPAQAQKAVPPDQQPLVAQCSKAQTPLECRAALPACEAALTALAPTSAGTQFDQIRDQLLTDWAWCENQLGQYASAEGHYRSLHALRVRIHGREHRDVAVSLNNLAHVLERQGKYAEAERLYRQALAVGRSCWGPSIAMSR